MMKKDLSIVLMIGCLLSGLISYGALAVKHYDVDPISVLASSLNISIPTLGYISGALSLGCLMLGITFWVSSR